MSLSPDRFLIGWGKKIRNSESPYFYFNDYFLSTPNPWVQYSNWEEISTVDFIQKLGPILPPAAIDWEIDQPEYFKKAFNDLMGDLESHRLQKAVPYVFAKSPLLMTQERLKQSLRKSLEGSGYLYGFWNEGEGLLGLTPELLFSHSQKSPKVVKTMAVAGTCHPSQDQEAFFNNQKERHEHQLVVQGISQSLHHLGALNIGTIQLLQLPKLIHLMTPIELELNNPFQFEPFVQALHPTPALGAFPKEEGEKWLEFYNKQIPRHYYGAPIGFNDPISGISRCFVAIRNVQWNRSGMFIGAGCGVVKQSQYENEWEEIQHKIKAIRSQLHL